MNNIELECAGKNRISRLTARESNVLLALASGFGNREIGVRLGISVNTAKAHIRAIYLKLDVSNRVEAINVLYGRNWDRSGEDLNLVSLSKPRSFS